MENDEAVHWDIENLSVTEKVALAILAAKEVSGQQDFLDWAALWLDGKDRTVASALATERKLTRVPNLEGLAHPLALTPPRISANARAAARHATEAAYKMTHFPKDAETDARKAWESARAAVPHLDLGALVEVARKIG